MWIFLQILIKRRLKRGYKVGFWDGDDVLFYVWAVVTQEFNLWQLTKIYTLVAYNFLYMCLLYVISHTKMKKDEDLHFYPKQSKNQISPCTSNNKNTQNT